MARRNNTRTSLFPQDDLDELQAASGGGTNHAPVVTSEWATLRANTSVSANEQILLLNDSDPDGDPLSIASYTDPQHGTLTRAADGTLTYTPNAGYTGTDSFTYMVVDTHGACVNGTVTLTVCPPSGPPTIDQVLDDVGPVQGNVPNGGTTDDSRPKLTGTAEPGAKVEVFNNGTKIAETTAQPDGSWSATPANPLPNGNNVLTAVATTPDGGSGTSSPYTIVNCPPGTNLAPIAGDDYVSLPAGTSISGHESVLLANDSDPEGGPLTLRSFTQPANGMLTRAADGTLTYTPRAGFTGTDTFTYTVADNQGATDVGTVTLQVTPPTGVAPTVTIAEDLNNDGYISRAELQGNIDIKVGLPATAQAGDSVNVTDNQGNVVGKVLTAADIAAGQVSFPGAFPPPAEGGTITVTAKLTDAAGNVSPTASDSAVFDGNYAPLAVDDTATLRLGLGFPQIGGNVLGNDSDPDGASAALRVSGVAVGPNVVPGTGVGQVLEGTYGHLTINPDGGYTYVADKAGTGLTQPVQDIFYYTNRDGSSADSATPAKLSILIEPSMANVLGVTSPQAEEGADLVFTVSTSAGLVATPVTLNLAGGSATVGVDTGPMQVNFGAGWQTVVGNTVAVAAGVTSFQVKVPTIEDAVLEANETVMLKAVASNGSNATGTGTICDDDLASRVAGIEDTPLLLRWSDFSLPVGGSEPRLVIQSLPADGKLQVNNGGTWSDASVGQQFSKSQIDAGCLRFMPDANESGIDAYNAPGVGNKLNDYARFSYGVDDGSGQPQPSGVMTVDIAPRADGGQTAEIVVLAHGGPGYFPPVPTEFATKIGFKLYGPASTDLDGSERSLVGLTKLYNTVGTVEKVWTEAGVQVQPDSNGVVWVDPSKTYWMTQWGGCTFQADFVLYRQEVNSAGTVLDQVASASKHWLFVSPVLLDLNGDGVQTVSADQGVYFDLDNDGTAGRTGWSSAQDGFLVRDVDGNGRIDNGSELFGSGTRLSDGTQARDGFVALADLDGNHDGKVSAADAGFTQLQVWQDANGDGASQAGELHSLASLGIVALNLAPAEVSVAQNGNVIGLVSSFTTADGQNHELADVWFAGSSESAPAAGLHAADLLSDGPGRDVDSVMGGVMGGVLGGAPAAPAAAAPTCAAVNEALAQQAFASHMARLDPVKDYHLAA